MIINTLVTILFAANLNPRVPRWGGGGGFLHARCVDFLVLCCLLQAGKFVLSITPFRSARVVLDGLCVPKQRLQFVFCQILRGVSYNIALVNPFKCIDFAAAKQAIKEFYANSFLALFASNAVCGAGSECGSADVRKVRCLGLLWRSSGGLVSKAMG